MVGCAVAIAVSSVAHADRMAFSLIGPPSVVAGTNPPQTRADGALDFLSVPTVELMVGETATLHLWMQMTSEVHNYNSVAWSVESSAGSVAQLTDHTVANFSNAGLGANRWDSTVAGTVGAAGSTNLLTNAYGFKVGGPGIGVGTGFLNALPFDQGRDDQSESFYLGSITIQATQAGTAGLYLRTGDFKSILTTGPANIQYGNSDNVYVGNVVGAGDPITGDLAMADAIIMVGGTGPVVGVTRTSHDGTDTSGDVVFDSVRNTFMDAGGATSGRINILNFLGDGSGDLPLFFDLVEGANAQQLVDDLNAAANGEYTAALSSFSAPNAGGGSSTADIEVRYAGVPAGGNFFVDFNFGDVGVAAVGVPEPSSLALVGMGLIGLVGYGIRRRRSA